MKKLFISLVAGALLLTGCSSGGTSKSSENSFVSGNGAATFIPVNDREAAPNISGATLDGTTFTLDKSRITVINVWASWCSPCRAEAPIFQDFATKNPQIQFLGILTRDNLSAARAFTKRFEITYPTLTDDSIIASFRGKLTPNAIPTTLILDNNGRIALRISGGVTVAGLRKSLEKVAGESLNG